MSTAEWTQSPRRWIAFPATLALVVVGVWIAGGVLADSFKVSMALLTVWFLVTAAAVFLVARSRRGLAMPLVAGYLIAAGGVGGYLFLTTIRHKTVNERVVVGAPASVMKSSSSAAAAAGPIQEQMGRFVSGEHDTSGVASIVRLPGGKRMLTLTSFSTSPGPDVRVRIVPGRTDDGGAKGNVDLGGLKGDKGNQQYELPDGLDPKGYSVVIWCRAFSAVFGSAYLQPS
jgi:hypothetical protein